MSLPDYKTSEEYVDALAIPMTLEFPNDDGSEFKIDNVRQIIMAAWEAGFAAGLHSLPITTGEEE